MIHCQTHSDAVFLVLLVLETISPLISLLCRISGSHYQIISTWTVEFPTENAKVRAVCKSTLVLLRAAVVKVVYGCEGDVPPGFCAVNVACGDVPSEFCAELLISQSD